MNLSSVIVRLALQIHYYLFILQYDNRTFNTSTYLFLQRFQTEPQTTERGPKSNYLRVPSASKLWVTDRGDVPTREPSPVKCDWPLSL